MGPEEVVRLFEQVADESLTILNLSGLQLQEIPSEIGKCTHLTRLNLSNTQITSIPEALGQLSGLRWLTLRQNQITSIPEVIGQLSNLILLDLNRPLQNFYFVLKLNKYRKISKNFKLMSLILEYLEKHPKEAKRLIGITAFQFQDLCSHAEILSQQKSEEVEINKIRINRKGAGCKPKLSIKEQVLLTLVYLSQLHTFQYLGIQFEVSESTAHNIFHKWVKILGELLPATLLEQFKKKRAITN